MTERSPRSETRARACKSSFTEPWQTTPPRRPARIARRSSEVTPRSASEPKRLNMSKIADAWYMPKTMPALAIVAGDFVRTGGMDMPNFALARRSAERCYATELVAYRVADELLDEPSLKWHPVRKPLRSYLLGSPLLDLKGRAVASRVQAQGGRVVVNGGNCRFGDVNWVHYVHAAYEPTDATSLVRRAKGGLTRVLSLARERAALHAARLVIANSRRTQRDLVGKLGVDASRIQVVYYGIDPERFKPPTEDERARARAALGFPERPHVAFVGALGDRRKGFDTLYTAWRELCASSEWSANLVVLGHGAELSRWKARADADRVGSRIAFLGFRRDVPDVLAACDALVAPTRYEAFGLGVQEALCCGLPALVSADAGVAELYSEELHSLLLADAESAGELRRRLEDWARNSVLLSEATRRLSIRLRQRTWDVMADQMLSHLS